MESKKNRVLIVDDTPENIQVLMEALKNDYAILAAKNGEKALRLAFAEPQPDIILLDIMMPGMDGYEVCRQLKADPRTEDIPVIFITALSDAADETKGLEIGAIDYITKPFNPDIVKARVRNHLHLREAALLKDDVERIMRHDLKSPLTSIISLPQLLFLAENIDDSQRELLKRIEDSGYIILSMVNLSTTLFKIERGGFTPNPEEVDLVSAIRKVLGNIEDTIELRGLNIRLEVNSLEADAGAVFLIQGEELLCFSMLANLISNAVEASAASQSVTIRLFADNAGKHVQIHNMGVVPADVRERFFEKYATAGKHGGTGLGTYSARLIARALGGDIRMRTSDEAGTTVTVSLP